MFSNPAHDAEREPLPPFLAPLREKDRNLKILIIISMLLTIFGTFQLLLSPPTDADAYEYAGVARSYLETGKFEHTMLPSPGYLSTNRNVPQPAVDRLTLWALVMIPTQAILGDSVWVFLIPALLAFFFLGPLAYLFAVSLFERRTAFFAALTIMLLPRIIHIAFIEDAGQPNFLFLDLMLVMLSLVVRHRWLSAGLFGGLMMATRYTGIVAVVAVFLWICLTERKQLYRLRFWAFFLLTTAIIAPFIIRASTVSESGLGSLPQSSILTADPDLMNEIHEMGMLTHMVYRRKPPAANEPAIPKWQRRAKVIAHNVGIVFLFGFNSRISSYPGFPGIVTLTLLPFVLIGLVLGLRDRRSLLPLLIVLIGLSAFSLRISYEDRYLFPQVAMAVMLAFHGAHVIGKRFHLVSPGRLFLVFLLLEASPNLAINSLRLIQSDAGYDFGELSDISGWIRRNTPEDAMMLTVPFWSPHYLTHRKTALLPLGDQHDFRDAARHYQADYMLFEWFWPRDQLPRLPFLTPLVRGQRHILYRIDRRHPAFLDPDTTIPYLVDFDWLGYFWRDRLNVQVNIPLYRAFSIFSNSLLVGWALYIVIWFGLLFSPNRLRRLPWIIVLILIPIIVATTQLHLIIEQFAPLEAGTPNFCQMQAKRFFASTANPDAVHSIRLALNDPATIEKWQNDWKQIGLSVSPDAYVPGQSPTPGEAVFVEVAFAPLPPGRNWYARDSYESECLHERYLQQTAFQLTQVGYRVEVLDAGVIGIPAEPTPE